MTEERWMTNDTHADASQDVGRPGVPGERLSLPGDHQPHRSRPTRPVPTARGPPRSWPDDSGPAREATSPHSRQRFPERC